VATKLHINASLGLVEVEGDERIVLQIYEDLREFIKSCISTPPLSARDEANIRDSEDSEPIIFEKKKKRAAIKRNGPSCASRILELKMSNFFSELRDTKAITDALSEKGHNYEGKHVAAALIDLVKRGTVRRLKKDGSWLYQNP
jgi:hypothetical protein